MYQETGPQGPWQPTGRLPETAPSQRNSAWPAILITFAIGLGIAFLSSPSGPTPDPPDDPVARMCQIASVAQQSQSEHELISFAEEFRQLAVNLPPENAEGEQVGAALNGFSISGAGTLLAAFQNFSVMCGR